MNLNILEIILARRKRDLGLFQGKVTSLLYVNENVNTNNNKTFVYRTQMEEAIAECQLERGVTFRLLDTAQEVSEWIYRYSKAIAEQPFK